MTSDTILSHIVAARRESVAHRQRVLPLVALKIAVEKKAPPPKDFAAALTGNSGRIIAELKKASPSRGLLRQDYVPAKLAPQMEAAGAAALSVLTEEDFFQGSLTDLKQVRQSVQLPLLRKDFIIDPWQVWEARAAGADSFLLIAAILEDALMRELIELGRELKMEPLIEVHSREELERGLRAGAGIVGVNNRDLRDFRVTLETSLELVEAVPDDCVAVSESGIGSRDDIERLSCAGFDAFLIGEHLMTQKNPALALRELLAAPAQGSAKPPARAG